MLELCAIEGNSYSTDYHRFYGDTIINDTAYKKVWVSEDESHDSWYFLGSFIREENKRVYYREMFMADGLLYDFNLNLGDSVLLNNSRAADNLWLTLAEIDSIETSDGPRERWRMESSVYQNSEYWIRGIGSESGVLNSGTLIFGGLCGAFTLLCAKQNEEIVFQHSLFQTCYYELLIDIDETQIEELELFKMINKNKLGQLELKFNSRGEKMISIFSINGQPVYNRSTHDDELNINTLNLQKGIYLIKCRSKGNYQTKKFIR